MNLNLNLQTDKKKIIIFGSAILVFILIIGFIIFLVQKNRNDNKNLNTVEKIFTPDFLSAEEKVKMQIPAEMKIQATTRDENGEVTVYKIIKNDTDIVDPAKVGPISPRAQQVVSPSN